MSDADEAREALKKRFPELQPLRHAPSMQTINGIGTGVYGRRDYDPETRSYVKTQCFCVVFIPLIALGSYRVVDAGAQSWYFLGRVPLSPLAKGWNYAVLLMVVVLGAGLLGSAGWDSYVHSDSYVQAQAYQRTQEQVANGDYAVCVDELARLATGKSAHAGDAKSDLAAIQRDHFYNQPGGVAVKILNASNAVSRDLQQPSGGALLPAGIAYIEANLASHPRDSEVMRNYLFKTCANHQAIDALEIPLLQALIAAEPTNPQPVSDLAQVYQREKKEAECEALLVAHQKILGDTEGAHILGQLYYDRGDMEQAYPLLQNYTAGRLKYLQDTLAAFQEAEQRTYDNYIAGLNRGDAPDSWYRQYKALPDDQAKGKMVDAWVAKKMAVDAGYQKKLAAFKEAAKIVPTALDLGIARLAHAHSLTDPAQRKAELESIEKLFLSMESVAGETDEYHLFYGQVCYWLGKREEGHQQFEDLIANNDRAADSLYAVALKLREVGEYEQAYKLGEEAYNSAAAASLKQDIAAFMALLTASTEEKAGWLAKADSSSHSVALSSAWLEVQKAQQKHDRGQVVETCTKLIGMAEKTTKTSSSLNLIAIAHGALYAANGDPAALQNSIDIGKEALTLEPKDSVLLSNLLQQYQVQLCTRWWAGDFQAHLVDFSPEFDGRTWGYLDQGGRDALARKAIQDPEYKTVVAAAQRQITLAPAATEAWNYLTDLYILADDNAGLADLLQRREALPPAPDETFESLRQFYAGAQNEAIGEASAASAQHYDDLITGASANFTPATRALLLGQWFESAFRAETFGQTVDKDLLVRRADEAWKLRPCYTTRWMQIIARYLRCLDRVGGKLPEIAAFRKKYFSLHTSLQIGWLLETNPQANTMLIADPDFKAATALVASNRQAFPKFGDAGDWLVFRATDPALAATVAESIRGNRELAARDRLRLLIAPMNCNLVADALLVEILNGHSDEAQKRWQEYQDKGLPLPPLPACK